MIPANCDAHLAESFFLNTLWPASHAHGRRQNTANFDSVVNSIEDEQKEVKPLFTKNTLQNVASEP